MIVLKGKLTLENMLFSSERSINGKKIYSDMVFYCLKDAKLYLDALQCKKLCRIISIDLKKGVKQ